MFGLFRRVIAGAASYLSSSPTSVKHTPTVEPMADNTTGSSEEERPPDIGSIVNRVVESATFGRRMSKMDHDTWNDMMDDQFEAGESAGITRMRLFKTIKIITPTPVQPEGTGDGDTTGTGTNPGTPTPVEPHNDIQRWHADEREWLAQLEKQRIADNHRAVLARIAEIEQQQAQRAGDDHRAVLASVAKFEQEQKQRAEDNHGAVMANIAKLDGQVATNKKQLESLLEDTDQAEFDNTCWGNRLEKQQNDLLETVVELRGRVDDLEDLVPIASTEQPQAETGGHDPEQLTVLITQAEGHDERIERLETAVGTFDADMMKKAFDWFEWANGNFQRADDFLSQYGHIPNQVKAIEDTHKQQGQVVEEALAEQKKSFDQEMRQQKEATNQGFKDLENSMREEMKRQVSSIEEKYEKALASKDKQLSEQQQRYDSLESKMDQILGLMNSQNAIPQSSNPVQGQPQTTAPPQQPNPWAPTPTAPAQGPAPSKPDAQMRGIPSSGDGVIDLDTEMGDAPSQPPKQHSRQPSQADVPMASAEPIIPRNNGNAGFARGSQPMGRNRPLNGTGLVQPIFQAPAPSAPPAQALNNSLWNGPVATGTGPSTPAPHARPDPTENRGEPLQRPSLGLFGRRTFKHLAGQRELPSLEATPSNATAPSKFGYNGAPPTVNKPQINWGASMEKVNFDPPADMDIDDDVKPLQTMARQALAVPAPATPRFAHPAPNNAPSANDGGDDTVMTDGSSSNAGGPSSTPSMPKAPAPTKPSAPKPAKKKVDPFIKKKPGATPSKPAENTSMAQGTQSKPASFAQRRQAAFASEFGSAPAPQAILYKGPSPSAAPSEFLIPGLTGAVNTSPFALKPKTPAPAPQPASPAFTPVTAAPQPMPQASAPVSPAYKPQAAAHSPTSPTYQPASPPLTPLAASPAAQAPTSPLANHAATSDTIQSATATNVFMKEVEKPVEQPSESNNNSAPEAAMGDASDAAAPVAEPAKPSDNAGDVQMSGAEKASEDIKKGRFEVDVNAKKHAAPEQMVPSDVTKVRKGESQDDAKAPTSDFQPIDEVTMENSQAETVGNNQDPQGDVPMQTDRRVIKAKGKAKQLGEAEAKRQMDSVMEESSWDAMGKAWEYQAAQEKKKAAAAADDEVDYADPNDVNDEDIHNTTMEPPKPNFRPTKYSINFFQGWKDHFLSWSHLSKQAIEFKCETEGGVKYFVDEVRKLDAKNDLEFLLHWASLPNDLTAFTRIEMEKLFDAFREETFYQALSDMDLDDLDPFFSVSRNLLNIDKANWFKFHRPDAF